VLAALLALPVLRKRSGCTARRGGQDEKQARRKRFAATPKGLFFRFCLCRR
jgi:hypothetical protein